jgi:Na+/alanine symporter
MNGDNIIKQAGIGSLNPFFVSILCFVTGLIVVSSGVYLRPEDGVNMVMVRNAFATASNRFTYALSIVVPLLSLSLCISSAFNVQNVYQYYFGRKTTVICILLQFVLITSSARISTKDVITIADNLYLSIAVPNILCLFLTAKTIKTTYKDAMAKLFGDPAKKKEGGSDKKVSKKSDKEKVAVEKAAPVKTAETKSESAETGDGGKA